MFRNRGGRQAAVVGGGIYSCHKICVLMVASLVVYCRCIVEFVGDLFL